jgi:hypothetical protein
MAKKEETKPKKDESKPKKTGKVFDHLFGVDFLEKIITWAKGLLNEKVLNFSIDWTTKIGHYALIASALLGILFALLVAIRLNSFFAFLFGFAWVLLVLVIQFTAHRFVKAGDTLIKNNPSTLSSIAFLDCLGFLSLIGAVIVLVIGIVRAVQGGGIWFFLMGAASFVLLILFALIAFNPATINKSVGKKTSAGQEAIGIIVFFLKGVMRLVPILFGVGITVGLILLVIDFTGVFGSESQLAAAWTRAPHTVGTIALFGLLPFLSYIAFVIFYLAIDIIRAILALPGKLDELIKK